MEHIWQKKQCFLQFSLQLKHVCASMSALLTQYVSSYTHTYTHTHMQRTDTQLTQQDGGDDAFSEAGPHVCGELTGVQRTAG